MVDRPCRRERVSTFRKPPFPPTHTAEGSPMDVRHLPDPVEQAWLIENLATLIEAQGREPLVSMPLVLPEPLYFPDRWSFDHKGLDRLVRRLMQYAGLGDLDMKVVTFRRHAPDGSSREAAGLFLGIVDGCCLFGFNEDSPALPDYMAGVMAHEVAHAWRAWHGLTTEIEEEEELLTDLTTAYLGFGVLATNNSFRLRTSGWSTGYMAYTSWNTNKAGYLPPQAFTYLLALQLLARDRDAREIAAVERHLEPDQLGYLRTALASLDGLPPRLQEALALREGEVPASDVPVESILRPLPPYEPMPEEEDATALAVHEPSPYPVFRVPCDEALRFFLIGSMTGLASGFALGVPTGRPFLLLAGLFAGMGIGHVFGKSRSFFLCSDPDCRVRIRDEERCPGCGRLVAGTITSFDKRLEAEERWEEERARSEPVLRADRLLD